MIDRSKIILMSRLAVYDQDLGEDDRKKDVYFRHDFIYRRNMWVRFFVALGGLVLVAFDLLYKVQIKKVDLLAFVLDPAFPGYLIRVGVFLVLLLVAYTILGTVIYTAQYEKAQKRLENYDKLIGALNKRSMAGEKARKKAAADAWEDEGEEEEEEEEGVSEYRDEPLAYAPPEEAAEPRWPDETAGGEIGAAIPLPWLEPDEGPDDLDADAFGVDNFYGQQDTDENGGDPEPPLPN